VTYWDTDVMTCVCNVAERAGTAIMGVYDGTYMVTQKADESPLTCADRAAHTVITEMLSEQFPDIPVLSEEGAAVPFEIRAQWQRFWLVDPLDGTKEFIKRNGEFTVNIALIEDGAPVMGVVYVPAQRTMYWGASGSGAFMRQGDAPALPIRVRRPPEGSGLTVVMSRSHPSAELETFLKQFQVAEALPVGSSLKLCVVAEGKADLYPRLGPTMEWDTAAGQAIVEAAGGVVCTLDGNPLSYNKENLLNPFFVVKGHDLDYSTDH